MNARLLASMDTEPFKEVPDLSPQPQLTNPNMPIPVQPGPVGAKYLAEAPALMPRRQAAPTPAAAMAQPAAQAPRRPRHSARPNWKIEPSGRRSMSRPSSIDAPSTLAGRHEAPWGISQAQGAVGDGRGQLGGLEGT